MGNSASCVGVRNKPCYKPWHDGALSKINRLRNQLINMVDVNNGLLDEMISRNLLTQQHMKRIRLQAASTNLDDVELLLDHVTDMTKDELDGFFEALNESGQSHVSNFIRFHLRANCNEPPNPRPTDWPLADSQLWNVEIRRSWRKLVELIDSKNGLLDEMYARNCITLRHKQRLEAVDLNVDRNQQLLMILGRRSLADFDKFLLCLAETKQPHVVHVLQSRRTNSVCVQKADCCALAETVKTRMATSYPTLVQRIDSKDSGLVAEMYGCGCITMRQKERIESAGSPADCNATLLDIMQRGSQSDFMKFRCCMEKTGQRSALKRLFSKDGLQPQSWSNRWSFPVDDYQLFHM